MAEKRKVAVTTYATVETERPEVFADDYGELDYALQRQILRLADRGGPGLRVRTLHAYGRKYLCSIEVTEVDLSVTEEKEGDA